MKRTIAFAILAAWAAPAPAAIRAVFVGIDSYAWSQARNPDAKFKDLTGAVRDTLNIKDAIRTAYRLDIDREVPGRCQSASPVSVTLTNECATKANILAAWNGAIQSSRPGDTLILYFAGHGSRARDVQSATQASQYNSTILATDARDPSGKNIGDILDYEVRDWINFATNKGVKVVSIFDSCNSGTVTRDFEDSGEARTAPPLALRPAKRPPLARTDAYGKLGGYRVHFAAAADGQDAKEAGAVGARQGVFTTAFADILRASPNAAFADLAAAVRLRIMGNPKNTQTPQAEGALRATLGGDEVRIPLFDAVREGDGVILAGGALTGVTTGSVFDLFPSTSAALPGETAPLASARVMQMLGASQAVLTLTTAPRGELPGRMIARERSHDFGGRVLSVRNAIGNPQTKAAVDERLTALPFLGMAADADVVVGADGSGVTLADRNGRSIARLGDPQRQVFAFLLGSALEKIARANALMGQAGEDPADLQFCVRNATDAAFDPYACPASSPETGPILRVNQPARISVLNGGDKPRFVYVLGIDEEYGITLLLPPNGGLDPAVEPGEPLVVPKGSEIAPNAPGFYRFVSIATDAPINAIALEQTGAGTLDVRACMTALARALCTNASGTRDPSMPRVNRWTLTVSPATVR